MSTSKLIFVNRFFFPNESATAQLLLDLCCNLAEGGLNVEVITSDSGNPGAQRLKSIAEVGEVKVRRVWTTRLGSKSIAGRIVDYLSFYPGAFSKLLRTTRCDDLIIVKTDPPMFLVFAVLVAKLKRARIICWLQDLYPEVAIELGVRGLRGPVGSILIAVRNLALRNADANVVIGARMAERLRASGVHAGKIHLLPNWADTAITPMKTSASRLRAEWAIPRDVFVLGYSGNLGRAHESETMLGAADLLRNRKDILFLFVGGGIEGERLRLKTEQMGLANFIFKSHQAREDLSHSLAVADAHWLSLRPELEGLIVPSKFYGIVSAGRTVVALVSATGEIAEAVKELDCGFVVEPGNSQGLADVISKLAEDRDHNDRIGVRSRTGSDARFARKLALERWKRIVRSFDKGVDDAERAAAQPVLSDGEIIPKLVIELESIDLPQTEETTDDVSRRSPNSKR